MDTPILLFAFRRPEHTRVALTSLALNAEAKNAQLFVFIDGPRNETGKQLVEAVAKLKSISMPAPDIL